ncbi:hypothetical protein SAMN04488077_13211 [Roseovarius tolerans]|uniref:Uncharacterized protein n=1 Tax=Roseovarius tolerans TaxID=74031 RepID=A0A1H8JKI4_9RHOB|nr:hypothetical protein [Roseovarius tolerans]SEN81041.1 hypothetical protein SAMN04488077_13211 [Roseovarius tolerans]
MGWNRRFGNSVKLTLSLLIAGSVAHAQIVEFPLAQDGAYYERLDEWGRVSGDIVMGVMIGPGPGRVEGWEDRKIPLADDLPRSTADVAVLHLPPASSEPGNTEPRPYCVRINSKDGRFEAVNTYAIATELTATGGVFPYHGEYRKDLDKMLAVSLVKAGRCGDRTELVVPSVWRESNQGDKVEALHVFINSAGNPTIAVPGSDPGYVPCNDVSDASTLKYTAACILPLDTLTPHRRDGRVTLTFYVTRSLGEESFEIDVVLPDGGG